MQMLINNKKLILSYIHFCTCISSGNGYFLLVNFDLKENEMNQRSVNQGFFSLKVIRRNCIRLLGNAQGSFAGIQLFLHRLVLSLMLTMNNIDLKLLWRWT